MANKIKSKSRIVFQSMACPKCKYPELKYPPASWEVIEHGSLAYCDHCNSDFEIKIELLDPRGRTLRAAEQRQDTALENFTINVDWASMPDCTIVTEFRNGKIVSQTVTPNHTVLSDKSNPAAVR